MNRLGHWNVENHRVRALAERFEGQRTNASRTALEARDLASSNNDFPASVFATRVSNRDLLSMVVEGQCRSWSRQCRCAPQNDCVSHLSNRSEYQHLDGVGLINHRILGYTNNVLGAVGPRGTGVSFSGSSGNRSIRKSIRDDGHRVRL